MIKHLNNEWIDLKSRISYDSASDFFEILKNNQSKFPTEVIFLYKLKN